MHGHAASTPILDRREVEGETFYTASAEPDGCWFSAGSSIQFRVSKSGRELTMVAPGPEDPEFAALVFCGMGIGLASLVRRRLVLHASAVGTPYGALLIVGSSGAGKSTLSSLLCAMGYPLMADDAVQVQETGEGWVAEGGATALRLRQVFPAVASAFAPDQVSEDGRMLARPPVVSPGPCSILGLVVADRVEAEVALSRLSVPRAVAALVDQNRLAGIVAPETLRWHLERVGALARAVPIWRLGSGAGPEAAVEEIEQRVIRSEVTATSTRPE